MSPRATVFKLQAGEIEDWAVGFSDRLAANELLTGAPKVTVHSKSSTTTPPDPQYAGVTVSAVGRNSAAVTDEDDTVHAINEAVEFRVTAANDAVAGQYTVRVECGTTAGRSLVEAITVNLSGPPET